MITDPQQPDLSQSSTQPSNPLEQLLTQRQVALTTPTPPVQPNPVSPNPAISKALDLLHGINVNIDPNTIKIIKATNPDAARNINGSIQAAFVAPGNNTINVNDWTDIYHNALKNDPNAIVDLAGSLAHERHHVMYGSDEPSAYDEQIRVMQLLHARNKDIKKVEQDKAYVVQQTKDLKQMANGGDND